MEECYGVESSDQQAIHQAQEIIMLKMGKILEKMIRNLRKRIAREEIGCEKFVRLTSRLGGIQAVRAATAFWEQWPQDISCEAKD